MQNKCKECGAPLNADGYCVNLVAKVPPELWGEPQAQEEQPKTLRDEFAMAILTGLIIADKNAEFYNDHPQVAYKMADAVLKQREIKT